MSGILDILAQLRSAASAVGSAIWAIDVRDDIASALRKSADAIEECYRNVNSASLREDAFAAALQDAIDDELLPIPATVIDDNSLPGTKIQQGSLPLDRLAEPVQITVDSALSDSSTNPVQNNVVKGAIDELNGSLEDLYKAGNDLPVYQTLDDYALKADGTYVADSNSEVKKYAVSAGDIIYLSLSGDNATTYQFQDRAALPSRNPSDRIIGSPVSGDVDEFVEVPTGATYLMVSKLKTTDTNVVKSAARITDRMDAAETAISELRELTLSNEIKAALLQIASKVAYIDDDGQNYYDTLHDAFYPPIHATAIELSSNNILIAEIGGTQALSATLTPANSTDRVTWTSSDTSVCTVNNGVVTAVAYGTATITATVNNLSATCTVLVAQASLLSISATYTPSGNVYSSGEYLDHLKSNLVVTASWSNSTTSVIPSSEYTLSGSLVTGTSTITVAYGNKTTTFTVTVASNPYVTNGLLMWVDGINNSADGAHASNLDTWVDQSGNNYDWTAYSPTITDRSMIFTSDTHFDRPQASLPTTVAMMEIVFKANNPQGAAILNGYGANIPGTISMRQSEQTVMFQIGSENTQWNAIVEDSWGVIHSYNSAGYRDGQNVTVTHPTSSWGYNWPCIGRSRVNTGHGADYKFLGEIYCIRLYNRVLTEQEILANQAADIQRFGIGA